MTAGAALHGHLHLVCERDAATGRTFVGAQSFAAPMHLSKPHWDGRTLIINAVNPTAGLFSGDTVEISVAARPAASALFTSPSASRVHRARTDEPAAHVRQRFTVDAGGWLEVCPEMLIAQAGSRYEQESTLEVTGNGGLLFVDCLAPGRVASGEVFAFEKVRCRTRLTVDGELVAVENCRLSPGDHSLHPLRVHHEHSYHATWFAVLPDTVAPSPFVKSVSAFSGDRVASGASALNPRAFVGKILAADSPSMRKAITGVRELVYAQAGRDLPLWRKL
jgi:urease accessory protein